MERLLKVLGVLAALAALHIASHYFGLYQQWRRGWDGRTTLIRLGCRREAVGLYRKDHPSFPPTLEPTAEAYLACVKKFRVHRPGGADEARTGHHPASSEVSVSSGSFKFKDSGGWAYDQAGGQVKVDCTHPSHRDQPWTAH